MASPPSPPPRPPRRPAAVAAEAALRALFRRQPALAPEARPPSLAPTPGGDVPSSEGAAEASGRAATSRALPPVDLAALGSLVRSSDYFAILGVPRRASPREIREAAARLVSELDLIRLAPQAEQGSAELHEIRQVVLDARDVLCDSALRAAYLKGIEDVAAPSPDVADSPAP